MYYAEIGKFFDLNIHDLHSSACLIDLQQNLILLLRWPVQLELIFFFPCLTQPSLETLDV